MGIVEFLITTIMFEKLRPYLLFKKNNSAAISDISLNNPVVHTVGDLRRVLENFKDDVPIVGSSHRYANVSTHVQDGIGRVYISSQSALP